MWDVSLRRFFSQFYKLYLIWFTGGNNKHRKHALLWFWGVLILILRSATENVGLFWICCCPLNCIRHRSVVKISGSEYCMQKFACFLISPGKILPLISKKCMDLLITATQLRHFYLHKLVFRIRSIHLH